MRVCVYVCVCNILIIKAHWFGIWDLPHPPFSLDLSPTVYLFFKHQDTFLYPKIFYFKGEVETTFKDFLASKPLDFYFTGINNLVKLIAKIHKCSGIIFSLIKMLFKFINSGIKVSPKNRHYFLNNLILKLYKNEEKCLVLPLSKNMEIFLYFSEMKAVIKARGRVTNFFLFMNSIIFFSKLGSLIIFSSPWLWRNTINLNNSI